ncbi:MAG: SH3 domain-containing protein, partial [Alistipes sp.]|nr:SH3 domain-containing protein [Alistipes sp.]
MKKLLLFFVALFCLAFANAQERYEVTSKSALNIRSSASASSTVLGTVQSGSKVDVYEVYGEWAKIKHNGRFAYVSSKYLKKCSAEASQNQKEE